MTTAVKAFPNCSLDAPLVVVDGVELLEVATGEVVGMLGRLEALEDKPVVVGLLDKLVTVAWLNDEKLLGAALVTLPRVMGVKANGPDTVTATVGPANSAVSTQSIT